jgi:DNA-binding transcriptional regulator YhcF (GntR family)
LLSFVPVHFAVYRPLKPRLRWAMQCLVSFADYAGRCFPSLRTFAVQAGISKSAAGRDLAELEAEGHLTRTRRPGGVYVYRIAQRFLPQWAREQVSQARDRQRKARHARRVEASLRGVPEPGTEEKPLKKNQGDGAPVRARFAKSQLSYGDLNDERSKWEARLRSWRQSRFWLPLWGPKPTEPGCFAPVEVLATCG